MTRWVDGWEGLRKTRLCVCCSYVSAFTYKHVNISSPSASRSDRPKPGEKQVTFSRIKLLYHFFDRLQQTSYPSWPPNPVPLTLTYSKIQTWFNHYELKNYLELAALGYINITQSWWKPRSGQKKTFNLPILSKGHHGLHDASNSWPEKANVKVDWKFGRVCRILGNSSFETSIKTGAVKSYGSRKVKCTEIRVVGNSVPFYVQYA